MRFVFLTLLVSFIFSIKHGNAQDHAAFLKECFELYQAESYKIKLKYSIYNGKSDAPVSKEILILKKGKNYLTKDSYNQVLLSDKYKLMMNKSFKTISIGYREQEEFNAPSLQGLNLDSIIGKGTQIKCISKNGAIHFYQIVNKEMPDLKTDIYIDTEKKKIDKVIYHSNDKENTGYSMIVINFTETDFSPKFRKNEFDVSQYAVKKNNKWVAADDYAGYRIIGSWY